MIIISLLLLMNRIALMIFILIVTDIINVISLIPFIVMNYEITETCGGSTEFPKCETYKSINCSEICIDKAKEICEKRNNKFCVFNEEGYKKKTSEYVCKNNFSCDNKINGSITIIFFIGLAFYIILCLLFYSKLRIDIAINKIQLNSYTLKTLVLVIFIMILMIIFDNLQNLYNLYVIFLMIAISYTLLLKIRNTCYKNRREIMVVPFV